MKIDVRIPYEPGGKLGWDYNRIMNETVHDWVLFLDHDVLLSINPHWYHLCQQAIRNHTFGMATCWTNAPHNTGQHWPTSAETIAEHRVVARTIYDMHGESVTPLKKASGFFMLINKAAWNAVGGFPGVGMFREDWQFSARLERKRYSIVRIDGLYVYHAKCREESWIHGQHITLDIKRREVCK
jgi:GT2 family glycosyltransferase